MMRFVDTFAEFISKLFGLCGHGKPNNWSVKVADFFFVDCGCCWFWRGVLFGTVLGTGIATIFSLVKGL
jgi:hypothetical protein